MRDPGTTAGMGRNVLVVSTLEQEAAVLAGLVGADDHVKVVVPVVKQGFLDWLANDEHAFSKAKAVASCPAEEILGAVGSGERDAVTDVLDPEEGAARSVDGVPVRIVVVRAS